MSESLRPDTSYADKPVSGGLILLLRIVQVVMVAFIAVVIIATILLALDGSFQESLFRNFETGSWPSITIPAIQAILVATAWLFVLSLLIRIIKTVQSGDPFVQANINRLRIMWMLIAGTEIFRIVAHAFADIAIGPDGLAASDNGVDIRIGTWFLVLIIAALSEAFRQGAEMRADAELTI